MENVKGDRVKRETYRRTFPTSFFINGLKLSALLSFDIFDSLNEFLFLFFLSWDSPRH